MARPTPWRLAAWTVCIVFNSAWESSSCLRAPTPTTWPSMRALKNVTAGSRSPSTSKACTPSGGVTSRVNARCRSNSARMSSARGSSSAMTSVTRIVYQRKTDQGKR